jgi:hypothetical protein
LTGFARRFAARRNLAQNTLAKRRRRPRRVSRRATRFDKRLRSLEPHSEPANVREITMLQRNMTARTLPFADLSDDQLLAEVHRLASAERGATAALIRSLIALDARPHLYLRDGCSSLFVYCTRVLHLSESETYNRIEVARAARRFPIMLDALEDGSVTLTALRLLAPHLTEANHHDVLAEARHKCKADVERLIARLRPQPDVPTVIRKLPERRLPEGEPPVAPTSSRSAPPVDAGPPRQAPSEPVAPPRTIVAPLSPERYKLELTISADTREKLRRVQDLMRHALPNGDVAAILDRALSSLLDVLERRRCAMTAKPRRARDVAPGSRSLPAAVRREVWRRDERRCAFVGQQGRCTETAFLELHHVDPYAVGGEATVDNIQLRCRAHNRYEAQLFFGSDLPTIVREQQPAWPA